MSEAAIRAGKAFVEIGLRDKVSAGLATLEQRFMSWGQRLAAVGGALTAAAGGVLGSLAAAAKTFADSGSEIFDLSRATGVGAAELSALGYAAEQSGASLQDISGAMKGLAKFTGQLSAGNKTAAASLEQLGVSAAEFLGATPYQRFLLVADALQQITDPSVRAAIGMKLLGRGALALGSLMAEGAAGVEQLVGEAQRLGLTVSDKEAQAADALGDAWDAVGKQFHQIAFVVGAAVAETFSKILQALQPVLAGTIAFVRNNQGLVTGLAAAAAAMAAAGAAFVVAGGAAIAFALALQIPTAAMAVYTAVTTAAAAVTAVVLTPVGLLIGSLVVLGASLLAAAGYWLTFTQSGQQALASLWSVIGPTLQGIFDALASGRWELAAKVMGAALNVGFQAAIVGLKTVWLDFQMWLLKLFAETVQKIGTLTTGLGVAGSALGLPGAEGVKALGLGTSRAGQSLTAGLDATHAAAASANQQRLIDATLELSRAIAEANTAREDAFKINTPPAPAGGGGIGSPTDAGFAAGTFNAAVAGALLSNAGSLQERMAAGIDRIADATERTADAVEEDDGLVAEE